MKFECKMSDGEAKEVTCKHCNKKIPLGNFCIKCGKEIEADPTDGRKDEPHPPIQATDDSSSTSGSSTNEANQRNSGTAVTPTDNTMTGNGQSDTANSTNVDSSSSYADALKSSQPKGKP